MTERALYLLRLTNLAHGDGIGEPDHMYLVGPFADGFERANFISRHNPEAKPGWVPVSAPSGLRLVGLPVFHPEEECSELTGATFVSNDGSTVLGDVVDDSGADRAVRWPLSRHHHPEE